ncbi:MAG: lipoprotein [Chlorobi bacterium]|nr:lipoprotein [Chlorobiota bacterium]
MSNTTPFPRIRIRPGRIIRTLLLAFFGPALCAISLSAQPGFPLVRRFQHTYGDAATKEYSEHAPSDGVAKCSHPLEYTRGGGYIMIGDNSDYGSSKILTVRATLTGSQIGPARTYVAGSFGTQGTDIHATADGGYAILGNRDAFGTVSSASLPGEILVIKTDGNGNVAWRKQYGSGTCREQAYSITQTKDGGYMVAGYVECPTGGITGVGDLLLIKLNANGSVAWYKAYNDFQWNYVANSVQQTSDGGYVVAGKIDKYNGGTQGFIMKVKGDGTFQWLRDFGGSSTNDAFYSVAIAADGGYVATGNLGADIYAVKVLSGGTFSWAKSYAGTSGTLDIGYDVKRNGENVVIAGMANNSKAFLMRLHSDGTIDFSKAYAPPGATSVARSVVIAEQGYAISGDVSTGNSDFYLVKTDADGDSYCNTENLTLNVTTQGDGAWIGMSTPSHSLPASDDVTPAAIGLGEAQLCYKQEYPVYRDASLNDGPYNHTFTNGGTGSNGNPTKSDPVPEPAVLSGHAWTTESVWVRDAQDNALISRTNGSLYEHELVNETPRFELGTNYIYAFITNHSDQATDPGTLNVYWSVASTNLAWPMHWNNYTSDNGPVLGDIAGTTQIPSIAPGESYVAEIPWTTPDPVAYGGTTPPISLLARYESETDRMTFAEGSNTEDNAINNNNIVWRNVVIVSPDDMTGGPTGGTKNIVIRNTQAQSAAADLSLSIPVEEADINPLFTQGNIRVDPGTTLYQQWVNAGRPGQNVEDNLDGTIRITGDDAKIGITLAANSEATIGIRFENTGGLLPFDEYYHYDVTQANGIGGVTFELQFPAEEPQGGEQPKTVTPERGESEGIAGGMLAAHPNPATSATVIGYHVPVATQASITIYDMSGNLVRTLVAGREVPAGTYNVQWDGADATGTLVGSGIYIYRLQTPLGILNRRLTIVR